jgi:hypothetical protein
MSDALTVVGTNGGITEKANGWFEVAVSVPGKQYPVKLATKKSEIIDAVRAVGAGAATFSYKEQDSERINPHTNEPYKNRYLEGVEAGGTVGGGSGTAGGSGGSQQMTNEDWNAKERRDFRSRAWAHTISAFHHTIGTDEDPALVFGRLRGFQNAVYKDIVREFDRADQSSPQQQAAPPPSTPDEPPHDEDDIPF